MDQPTTLNRPKRLGWAKFSLRSLLVLVTLAAIVMGWVAKERAQSRHELETADYLRALGVHLEIGYSDDPVQSSALQSWWREKQSQVLGPRINAVVLRQSSFADLTPLARLTSLRRLELYRTQVREFKLLAGLKNLQSLNLMGTTISDLAPLAGLRRLEWLNLDGTLVTDLRPLEGLGNLHDLNLNGTRISDLTPLVGLTNVQSLHLQGTQVTSLAPLKGLTKLTTLCLNGTNAIDLTPLCQLKNLKSLQLYDAKVSEEQVRELQQALPNCKTDR